MQQVWNRFYKNRGRFYLTPHTKFPKVIQKFQRYKIRSVVDLGCGSGRHSIELAKKGFQVTGVDFSHEAIELARKWALSENLDINFINFNIYKELPFKNDQFDAAIAIDSLFYESTETLQSTLSEIHRIINGKGLCFSTFPTTIKNPLVTHLVFTKSEIKELVGDKYKIVNSFSDKQKNYCVFIEPISLNK